MGSESAAGKLWRRLCFSKRMKQRWDIGGLYANVESFELLFEAVHKDDKRVSAPIPECTPKDGTRRSAHFYTLVKSIEITLQIVEDLHYLIHSGSSNWKCAIALDVTRFTIR